VNEIVTLDGSTLSTEALMKIARGAECRLDDAARARMDVSAGWFESASESGVLREKSAWLAGVDSVVADRDLVRGFVLSHCAGIGAPLEPGVVRATMAARVNVLAVGMSGCRSVCADTLIAMLNRNVVPIVPSRGAVGAAGSTPLAHMLRVACGYGGQAWRDGRTLSAMKAMDGIRYLQPTEKEALSLINGSTLTAAMAGLVCSFARSLLHTAEAACALSFEVVRADLDCLNHESLAARNHTGAVKVARRIRARVHGSEMVSEGRTPDPFSIRCAPVVLGAAWDVFLQVERLVERELNGACDNPLLVGPNKIVEGGNFHGAPLAMAMDFLKVALTEVAAVSERRTFRMTYGQLSGLPSFLVHGTGTNSGLMLAQYTAASLVSECKVWSHPASVDSIPTAQHQEDHVSMGPIAARAAWQISHALADVLAIELMCGAQGLDFRLNGDGVDEHGNRMKTEPLQAGEGTLKTYQEVRGLVARWEEDRVLHPDLESLGRAVRRGEFSPAS
jgi:histidine ammonia-lyase